VVDVHMSAVIWGLRRGDPCFLALCEGGGFSLPSMPIESAREPLEGQLASFVTRRTGVLVEMCEQFVTVAGGPRSLVVGYLGLVGEMVTNASDVAWIGVYEVFPQQDRRTDRRTTGSLAGLVPLSRVDIELLTVALKRLRSALTYRPVIFNMLAPAFTIHALQLAVEAIAGVQYHSQNFRRLVLDSEVIEPIGVTARLGRGRPAALYRFRSDAPQSLLEGFRLPSHLRVD